MVCVIYTPSGLGGQSSTWLLTCMQRRPTSLDTVLDQIYFHIWRFMQSSKVLQFTNDKRNCWFTSYDLFLQTSLSVSLISMNSLLPWRLQCNLQKKCHIITMKLVFKLKKSPVYNVYLNTEFWQSSKLIFIFFFVSSLTNGSCWGIFFYNACK